MFRLKVVTLFAIPVLLTTVLWVVAAPAAEVLDDENARLVGFLLLGIALLSTIFVFRSALGPATSPGHAASPSPSRNEFRRGFVSAQAPARKQRPPRPGEIIALRRHRIEPRIVPRKPTVVPVLAPETIETLKRRLNDRAEKLWSRPTG